MPTPVIPPLTQLVRFVVTGSHHDVEMIGAAVCIPSASTERFAVHVNVHSDMKERPYTVTHVESGFRLGGGSTIDAAIIAAVANASRYSKEQLEQFIEMGKSLRASVTTTFR